MRQRIFASAAGAVVLVTLMGCDAAQDHSAKPRPSTQCPKGQIPVGETGACAPDNTVARKQTHIPVLAKGRSVDYTIGADSAAPITGPNPGPVKYRITATDIKVTKSIRDPSDGYTAKADGQFVCVQIKLRNIGRYAQSGDQTSQLWFGKDGKSKDVSLTLGAGCDSIGMEGDDLVNMTTPNPGHYIVAWLLYDVPDDQPGAIVNVDPNLTTADGTPHILYRINYTPESAQVPDH